MSFRIQTVTGIDFFSVVYHKNKIVTDEMKSLIEVVKNYKHVDILHGITTGKLIK